MFYCDDCANKNKWAGYYGMPQSLGPCEECKRVRPCYDAPVKKAPTLLPHDGEKP